MPVTGADVVAENIKKFGGGFTRHASKVMKSATKLLYKEVTKNIGLTDHSQADLTRLGHPYARKHGPEGAGIHNPPWLIHKQSGRLMKSRYQGSNDAEVIGGKLMVSGWVGLDPDKAPHAPALIFGTWRMIPRDALRGSLADSGLQKNVRNLFTRDLRDMVINFRGAETRG